MKLNEDFCFLLLFQITGNEIVGFKKTTDKWYISITAA